MKLTPEQRIERLECNVRALIVAVVFVLLWQVCGLALGADHVQAAMADRQKFPQHEWARLVYLSTSESFEPERTARVGAFVVASTSRQPILEYCIPQRVAPELYRIKLDDLHWDLEQWAKVLEDYPYAPSLAATRVLVPGRKRLANKLTAAGKFTLIAEDGSRCDTTQEYFETHARVGRTIPSDNWYKLIVEELPLVVRMDWLIVRLTDANESDAYYRLLYGAKIPQTRDEFIAFWEVTKNPKHSFGLIEGESGVAKQNIRRITVFAGFLTDVALTEDAFRITSETDPLTSPERSVKHDGEEGIITMYKLSIASGTACKLQAYFLADGKGNRIEKADGDLVEDDTKFRGKPQIRTAGSCMQCHSIGFNWPKLNEFRHLVEIGVDVYAKRKSVRQQLESFHLSDMGKYIERNNEDFAAAIEVCNGLKPEDNALQFKATVNAYDAELSLEDAARELGTDAVTLKLALIRYTDQVNLPRLVALALGQPILRSIWEEQNLLAKAALREKRK